MLNPYPGAITGSSGAREEVTRQGPGTGKRQTWGCDVASAELQDPQRPEARPPNFFPRGAPGSRGLGPLGTGRGCIHADSRHVKVRSGKKIIIFSLCCSGARCHPGMPPTEPRVPCPQRERLAPPCLCETQVHPWLAATEQRHEGVRLPRGRLAMEISAGAGSVSPRAGARENFGSPGRGAGQGWG